MTLDTLDWVIISVYLLATMSLGLIYSGKAGGSLTDFFLAGRKLPWWLAGTSIVATTFAADTPLVVSGFIRRGGIYENWFWWSAALGSMVSVAFYARLWRRSGLLTDLEFIEMRYSGPPAAWLRLFLALYSGVVANCITLGWVMLAMTKVANEAFGWPETVTLTLGGSEWALDGKFLLLGTLMLILLTYTITAGIWGVVTTDALEFTFAMGGAIALMVLVYMNIGGPAELVEKVAAAPGVTPDVFAFIPTVDNAGGLAVFTVAVYLTVQWWAGTAAATSNTQRVLATKDERAATYGTLWGSFAHYVVRPWPWIIVGLASLVYFPLTPGEDPEAAYPKMMMELLPTGLRGLMVVSFLAAFMSTVDVKLNWGASYLVNDVYKRFVVREAPMRHYLLVSRVVTLLLMGGAMMAAYWMESIAGAWMYLAKMGAGAGMVVLLRWFWWRINAWSEISALLTSWVLANVLPFIPGFEPFAYQLLVIVGASTLIWLAVTVMTAPTDTAHLERFFRVVRPGGWWGPIAARCPDVAQDRVSRGWPAWFSGLVMIYAALFGLGYLFLGDYLTGLVALAIAAASFWFHMRSLDLIMDRQDEAAAAGEAASLEDVPASAKPATPQ